MAIAKLACLGNGYHIMDVGDQRVLVSVPLELSTDHAQILEAAKVC